MERMVVASAVLVICFHLFDMSRFNDGAKNAPLKPEQYLLRHNWFRRVDSNGDH